MKRTIGVYGLMSGLVIALLLSIESYPMTHDPNYHEYGLWVGYACMLLAFTFIYIAIKSYRDEQLGGTISFGKAFMTGFCVSLIASAFYTITWMIIYKNFYPNFLDDMMSRQLANMQKAGKSAAAIAKQAEENDGVKAVYATWPGLIGFTMLEVLPPGILVSLVCALILKRKRPVGAVAVHGG